MARLPRVRAAQGERGELDFEDVLELAIRLFETDEQARGDVRGRYRAFTVDEYQDVNLLQQRCSTSGSGRATTSASSATTTSRSTPSPAPRRSGCSGCGRVPARAVVRLEENYRSTPQVLELANRLVPSSAARRRRCGRRAPTGPSRTLRPFVDGRGRGRVARGELRGSRRRRPVRGDGDPLPDERAAGRLRGGAPRGGLPFQGSSLLGRDAARRLLRQLEATARPTSPAACASSRASAGWLEDAAGQARRARADPAVRSRPARPARRGVRRRRVTVRGLRGGAADAASTRAARPRGVHLLTSTARRASSSTPSSCRGSTTRSCRRGSRARPTERAEERRLLYVGMTRARRWLASRGRGGRARSSPSSASRRRALRAAARGEPERDRRRRPRRCGVAPRARAVGGRSGVRRSSPTARSRRSSRGGREPLRARGDPRARPARAREVRPRAVRPRRRRARGRRRDAPPAVVESRVGITPAASRRSRVRAGVLYHAARLMAPRRARRGRAAVPRLPQPRAREIADPSGSPRTGVVPGIGPAKLDRYGDEAAGAVRRCRRRALTSVSIRTDSACRWRPSTERATSARPELAERCGDRPARRSARASIDPRRRRVPVPGADPARIAMKPELGPSRSTDVSVGERLARSSGSYDIDANRASHGRRVPAS